MPARAFHMMPSAILIGSAAIIGIGSLYSLKLVNLSEMYKYRAEVALPGVLQYAVWIVSNALLPLAFACFVTSKRIWQAGIALLLMLLFYPIMLTKMALRHLVRPGQGRGVSAHTRIGLFRHRQHQDGCDPVARP